MYTVNSQTPDDDKAKYIIEDTLGPTITLKAFYLSDAVENDSVTLEKAVTITFYTDKVDVTEIARDWMLELPYTMPTESGEIFGFSHISGFRWLLSPTCLGMEEKELFRIVDFQDSSNFFYA